MSDGGLREVLAGSAYATGWAAVRRMPERAAYGLFQRLADQASARRGRGVLMLESNLRRVVGPGVSDDDLRRLTRAGMRSYLRYWCEVFRLPTWSQQKVLDRVVIHRSDRLHDVLDEGHGLVLALPHAANWDAAAAWVTACGLLEDRGTGLGRRTFTTVAERLKPESLFDRFVEYRESLGLEVLPLTGGGNVVSTLARRLKDGGLVVLPADRDLSGGGPEVDFFGAPARMPGGPAMLSLLTGAAVLPVDLWYDAEGRTNVRINDRIAVSQAADRRTRIAEMTQAVATSFERGIAEHPEDWHMLQPLWIADVDAAKDADEVTA